jgi:hypothetical protein
MNQSERAKRNRQSDEYASYIAAEAQGEIAAAGRDHQPHEISEKWP